MTTTKTFSTAVILSTATGVWLPGLAFSEIGECIEHLLGHRFHPVHTWFWTTHAPEPLRPPFFKEEAEACTQARAELFAQHPAFHPLVHGRPKTIAGAFTSESQTVADLSGTLPYVLDRYSSSERRTEVANDWLASAVVQLGAESFELRKGERRKRPETQLEQATRSNGGQDPTR